MISAVMRYKHRCPGCRKSLFTRVMYCRHCSSLYPERRNAVLFGGQQKWLKGHKLVGIPSVEPRLVIEIYGRNICLECGVDVSVDKKHKCYTKSWASGYRGTTIICAACSKRKKLAYFPVIIRRIRGHGRNDVVRVHICSFCLQGKLLRSNHEI